MSLGLDYDALMMECQACGEPFEATEPVGWPTRCDECAAMDPPRPLIREGQAPVTCDGAHGGVCDSPACYHDATPVRIDDVPTARVRTLTDAELLEARARRLEETIDEEVDFAKRSRAIQALRAIREEQSEVDPETVPWPVQVRE